MDTYDSLDLTEEELLEWLAEEENRELEQANLDLEELNDEDL